MTTATIIATASPESVPPVLSCRSRPSCVAAIRRVRVRSLAPPESV
eukprot:CAMPEP_0119055814 /NCGR_PEP_ID=MMETSP1178-20130426/419_1 /TAXON_ID=33656 /ORGANISM="unid sp, Strain CCMP2000" /LENGTH=45 /DNA_ID= /DNA_START= /DNA_END= /DNA_ORIENTATION=